MPKAVPAAVTGYYVGETRVGAGRKASSERERLLPRQNWGTASTIAAPARASKRKFSHCFLPDESAPAVEKAPRP